MSTYMAKAGDFPKWYVLTPLKAPWAVATKAAALLRVNKPEYTPHVD